VISVELSEDEASIIASVLGLVKFRLNVKYPKLFNGRKYRRLHTNDATDDTLGHVGRQLIKRGQAGEDLVKKLGISTKVKKKDFVNARMNEGLSHKEALGAWKDWKNARD